MRSSGRREVKDVKSVKEDQVHIMKIGVEWVAMKRHRLTISQDATKTPWEVKKMVVYKLVFVDPKQHKNKAGQLKRLPVLFIQPVRMVHSSYDSRLACFPACVA